MYKILLVFLFLNCSASSIAVSVGDMASNFQLKNIETGKLEGLDKYLGKVVYLSFWVSGCDFCRQSLPFLNDLRQELDRTVFEVIVIYIDENTDDAKTFLKRFPVEYPVLIDPRGIAPRKYGLPGMPSSVLIDQQGRVQEIYAGFKRQTIKEVRKQVISLL